MITRGTARLLALLTGLGGLLGCPDAFGDDNTWTITCATPTQAGTLSLIVKTNTQAPLNQKRFDVALTGQETAAQKATKVANVLDNTTFPITATAAGNQVTVDSTLGGVNVTSIWAASDSTGEVNQLFGMVPSASNMQVALVEFPAASPTFVPPAGPMASVTFTTDTTTITGSVTSDGVSTAASLLSALNISTHLTFMAHSDALSGRTYLESQPFDPITAGVQWDAFTSLNLANFGLDFVPEPAGLVLLPLCGITLLRRPFGTGSRRMIIAEGHHPRHARLSAPPR